MENQIREFTKRGNRKRLLKRVVSLLCVVVLLFTMNTLKRNANTLERIAMCGLQEHAHTAECYNSSGELVCAIPEHVHTDACYQQSPTDGLALNVDGLEIAGDLVDASDTQNLDLSLDLDQGDLLDFVQDSGSQASDIQSNGNDMPALDGDLTLDAPNNDEETQHLAVNTSDVAAQSAPGETADETPSVEGEQPADEAGIAIEDEQEQPAEEGQEQIDFEQAQPVEEETEQFTKEETEQPAEAEQAQPTEETEEQPAEETEEQPAGEEAAQEQPTEETEEQPTEETEEQPAEEEAEQPAEETNLVEGDQAQIVIEETEQPVADAQEQPVIEEQQEPTAEETEEQPTGEEMEQPAEETEEQPAEETEEQPAGETEEQPAGETEEQPAEETEEQPAEETEEQPTEETEEQPAEETEEQPAGETEEQPTEETEEQPTEETEEQPAEEEAEQPAEVVAELESEGEAEAESEAQIAYPAQQFQQGTAYINVSVDAPEGAFPEGTVMVVRDVEDQGTIDNIQQSVTEDFVEVTSVHAVDISFWYNDAEIEPLLPIAVVMSAVEAPNEDHETVVVHVDDHGETQLVDSEATGAAEATLEMPAAADAEAQAFEADTFSVYALVTKQTIETKYIDDQGDTWRIKVDYGRDAKLPEGASLQVAEVTDETYLAQAEAALESGKRITKARFFDIKIMDGDREVQPDDQVKVTITLDGDEGEIEATDNQNDIGNPDVVAMHFVEQDDETVSVEKQSAVETDEGVVFNADGFSAWGVIYTVDFEVEGDQGEITLDFTAFDAATLPEEGEIYYDTEDCSVHVALGLLTGIINSETEAGYDIDVNAALVDNYEFDFDKAEMGKSDSGMRFEDGELVIEADGFVELTEGERLLRVRATGLTALKQALLETEGVSIEVIEGNVPLGSEASYTAHTDAETAELVENYINNEENGDSAVAGYSAADLKIVRNDETLPVEGQFKVTVDKASLVPEGMKLEKLYHIHRDENDEAVVEELAFEEAEAGLVFELANFSDIVASYTVEFHYAGQQVIIQGGTQALLSSLINGLGLTREDGTAFGVDDVENVEFDTPELFLVEEVTDIAEVNGTEVVLATSHDFLITSLRPFKEDQMTLTLTDGSQIVVKVTDAQSTFTSKIKFFAQNASIIPKTASTPMHIDGNLEAPTLTKYYYLLATLYDNDDNKLGWAIEPVAVPDQSTSSEITLSFSEFYQFEEDKLPGAEGYGSMIDENKKISYNSDQNRIETRLYRFDYPLQGVNLCYNTAVTSGNDHPEEGYEFGGNFINSDGINEVHLKKAVGDKKYYVRVRFDEEASTAFENGDRYYVNVKVHHASNQQNEYGSYQYHELVVNPSTDLTIDPKTGLRYIQFDFTNWMDESGQAKTGSSTSFTGYEDYILVELVHGLKEHTYQPKYDPNNAKPIPEGTLAKSYRVHYDTKQTNPKDTPTGFYEDRTTDHVYCYDYIDLMTISATDDYDFNTILGPNVGYGIVADHLFQGNDLQTNFAVNHYSAHGHYVSPDLSGQSSGAIVIGEFNVVDGMAENGTGEVAYDDTWGKLPIGNVLNNTLIVYADENTGYNAPDGNVGSIEGKSVIVQHADGAYLSQTMVQPGIDYGIAMSNALMSHPDTFTPADPKVVDTTGFPDGATIYVDGDPLANTMAQSGQLIIKKMKNQTIVFNFDTTRDLTLAQFHYEQYTASGTKEFELNTSTDVSQTEQNKHMDEMSRHIVWNLNGVKGKTVIKEGGGIYLQPNRNSEIDIQATSGGWIVSNGFVYNSTAEWHNFFVDMPDTNKLNLKAIKTVDGMIPRDGQQFEFFLKEYNPDGATEAEKWTQLFSAQTVKNTNAVVAFPEMHDLEEGWHVYKIHENKTQAIVNGSDGGKYIVDQTDFYALVHVVKTTDNSGTRYIITPPAYYKNFDDSKFSKATGGVEEGAFSDKVPSATFDNEAVKEGLTIEKKVVGTTDAIKRFTFEVTLTNGNDEPLTGSYQYTVSNVPGEKTLTLDEYGKGTIVLRSGQKATIKDLPVGTKYMVTETKVGAKAIVTENKDTNGYVDGYQTPAEPVSGTIEDSKIAVASFTNVYHAEGTVPLKAKKVMHNASADNEEMSLQAGQFRFTLTPLNSATATPETVTNDANGNVHFTALNFTEADMTGAVVLPNGSRTKTLIYYVTESDGDLPDFNYGNVTYDSNKVVLIILTDDGEGHITAKSNLDEFTVGINNTYEYKAPAHLEANKKLTGRDMKAGEFTFTARLFKTEVNSETKTYPTNETVTEGTNQYKDGQQIMAEKPNPDYVTEAYRTPTKLTATNAAADDNGGNPPVSRSAVEFPTVYYTEPGVYYYQITENTGAGDLPMGVTAVARTYYAKVTAPVKTSRNDQSVSTVEYFTDEACTVSVNGNDVLFENTQDNINFTVTKSWTDANGNQKNAGYSIVFSVKQNGRAFPITQKHLEVVSGEQRQVEILEDGTVRLIGNASGWPVVKIKNVPKATYVVTETEKNGDGAAEYSTTYNVGDKTTKNHATVSGDDSTVTIYNTKGDDKYTTITVEKKWMAGETEYTPTEGEVTFKLTKTEKKQVEATGGKKVHLKIQPENDKVTLVTVGNKIIVSYKITFNSASDKKTFYEQYQNHRIQVQYCSDCNGTTFNGNASSGNSDNDVHIASPANISAEERARIEQTGDTAPITATFEIPTKGTIPGTSVSINNDTLQGIYIKGASWGGNGTREYLNYSEEPTYDTKTTYTYDTFTVTAADGWRKVLSGLPLSKSDPVTSYTYTVEETAVNGAALEDTAFTVTYSGSHEDIVGGTVVATNTKESVMVTVNKQWKFPNGSTTWPEGVTVSVKLQDKGEDVAGKTATLDAEHPSAIFDDLDKEGVYTVVETGTTFTGGLIKLISGDATNGFTITNYATDTDVTVQKTWDTVPTEDWTATFKLQKARVAKIAEDGALLATPEAVATETWTNVVGQDNITISKAGPNPVTLTGLPVAEEDGNAVYSLKYQVVETKLTIGSDTTTNRIDPETGDFRYELVQAGEAGNSYAIIANNKADDTKTSLTVNKVWQGGNPPADASIAVTLGRFKLVEQQPGTITITDSHSGLLSGDTYSVQYTISGGEYVGQTVTSGMSVPAGTYTITKTVTVDADRYTGATNASESRSGITVDEGGETSVTFNETVFTPITGTLTISDDYTGAPGGYSVSYRITGPYGYDRTTTETSVSSLPKGAYTVAKTVTAPSGYTITSNATDTQTVEVDGNGGTANMAETVFEEQSDPITVNFYAFYRSGEYGSPANSPTETKYALPGSSKIVVGFKTKEQATPYFGLSPDNMSIIDFSELKTQEGYYDYKEYDLTKEISVNGATEINVYLCSGFGAGAFSNFSVSPSALASAIPASLTSNRLSAPRTLSKGASRGLMANAAPATTTGEVTVTTTTIIVNNSAVDPTYSGYNNVTDSWSKEVTLNNGNSWSAAADMLPKADAEGHEYVYYIASVTETNVPTGTTAVITTADGKKQVVRGNHADGDNATLSLTDTLPKTSISANKTWVHGANPQASQPTSVKFTLYEDGVSKGEKMVTSTNNWTVAWDNLELYKADGTKHSYSVTEENVTDYVLTSTTFDSATQTFKLTNTYTPTTTELPVNKVWAFANGSTAWPEGVTVTVTLYKSVGGAEAVSTGLTKQLTAANTSDTFTDLPLKEGDKNVTYSVRETGVTFTDANNFTTSVNGTTITNTEKKGNLSLTKMVTGTTDATKEFTFHVTLNARNGGVINGTYNTVKQGTTGTQAVTGGTPFDVTLKAGETWQINDLPVGATWTVTEDKVSGYTLSGDVVAEGGKTAIESGATVVLTATNVYEASTTFQPKVQKTFTNGVFTNDQFEFILTEVDDAVSTTAKAGTTPQTVKVSNGNAVPFTTITYDQTIFGDATSRTKDFYYTIAEKLPEGLESPYIDENGIQYDPTVHRVKVTVTDGGDGTLSKIISLDNETVEEVNVVATFTNEQLGQLQITKRVVANGEGVDKTGTFWYAVFNANDVQAVGVASNQTLKPIMGRHSVSYGSIVVDASGTGTATVPDLPYGDYYVFELSGEPTEDEDGQHLSIIPNGTTTTIDTKVYTVTGSGTTAVSVGENVGQAELTNTVPETSITGQKTWKPYTSDQGERKNPVNTTLTLTLTRYTVNGSTYTEDNTFGTHQVTITADADGAVTLPNGKTIDEQHVIAAPDLSTEAGVALYQEIWSYTWNNLPLYGNSTDVKYAYMVNETVSNDWFSRQAGENSGYLPDANGNTTQQFTNVEKSPVSLPATGGMGTGVVYGAGAALLLLAVLGLILLNRKRTDGEGIR